LLHHPQLFGSEKGDVLSFDPGVILIIPGAAKLVDTKRTNEYVVTEHFHPDVGVLVVSPFGEIHQPEQLPAQLATIVSQFYSSHTFI
jgi:hypothetical protein